LISLQPTKAPGVLKNTIEPKDLSDFTRELWAAAGEVSSNDAARADPDGGAHSTDFLLGCGGGESAGVDVEDGVDGLEKIWAAQDLLGEPICRDGENAGDDAEGGLMFFGEDGELLGDDATPSFLQETFADNSAPDDILGLFSSPPGSDDLFRAGVGVDGRAGDGGEGAEQGEAARSAAGALDVPKEACSASVNVVGTGHPIAALSEAAFTPIQAGGVARHGEDGTGGCAMHDRKEHENANGFSRESGLLQGGGIGGVYSVRLVRQGGGAELGSGQVKRDAALKSFYGQRILQLQVSGKRVSSVPATKQMGEAVSCAPVKPANETFPPSWIGSVAMDACACLP